MSVGIAPPPPPPSPPTPRHLVAASAVLECSMGMAPSTLLLPTRGSKSRKADGLPLATVDDHLPVVNVPPFALCRSTRNPAVQSATAAAGGVLTPAPCMPVLPDPWSPGAPGLTLDGPRALSDASTLPCQMGGTVSIVSANCSITVP